MSQFRSAGPLTNEDESCDYRHRL